ncbi:hypothetical protein BHM03_00045219 [Ensete ventricosum]|nr:hypothetical protein BHM03_00045219 [Ensete ventricosum]
MGGITAGAGDTTIESHPENRVVTIQSPTWAVQPPPRRSNRRLGGTTIAHRWINYDREKITIRGLAKVKSKHRAKVRIMRLETRLECVRSSLRVLGAYLDGAREFNGRRPRLVGRLSGVVEMLVGSKVFKSSTISLALIHLPSLLVLIDPNKKPVFVKVEPPLKRLKKLGDSPAPASKLKPKPAPVKGSNRKEKGSLPPVHEGPLVIDNLSLLNKELRADVQRLKDESSLMAVATTEVGANKAIAKLEEVQCGEAEALKKVKALQKELQGLKGYLDAGRAKNREMEEFLSMARAVRKKAKKDLIVELSAALKKAWATIAQYKESPDFKLGLKTMGWINYEFRYKIVLTCFWTKHPRLEVEEDPYATLPEDDNVPMEVEVPFDDSDPIAI